MKVVNRFVLKAGDEAKGVAKIVNGGGKNYVEASCAAAFDAVIANVGGKAVEIGDGGVEGEVRGVALFGDGVLVASGGEAVGFAPKTVQETVPEAAPEETGQETEVTSDQETVPEAAPEETGQETEVTSEEKPQPPTESAEDESAEAAQTAEEEPEELVEQGAPEDEHAPQRGGQGEFFKLIEQKLKELFDGRERASDLEALFPDSQWVRVDDGGEAAYVVGVVGDPVKFICYGVPDADGSAPPKGKEESRQWLPVPGGGGYWMMYQSAEDGSTLTAF